MDTRTQDVPGYYVWEPAGSVKVHLQLDVLDRMGPEIMRGFGAVPKRGAEVGGLLLGSIQEGDETIVRIDDFEPVACDYKRGPSYLFTDDDGVTFEDTWGRWQPDGSKRPYVVGFFRSNTRESLTLAPEDVDLMERYFPNRTHTALLIKPFATKVSLGGFFFRDEHGLFPGSTPLEFPFRRRELTGEESPRRRALSDRRPRPQPPQTEREDSNPPSAANAFSEPRPEEAQSNTSPRRGKIRSGWVWMPLSFIFLLLGVLLGFQSALTMAPKSTGRNASDYSLALAVAKTGDNLTVKWNRDAAPVRAATRGVLEIDDEGFSKPVELDAAHLQGGSIIYRNSSNTVHFRLTVYLNARLTITETLDWRQ